MRLIGILKEGDNVAALRTLIRTTMAMFGVPLFVMGATHALLPASVCSDENRMVCAGVAALVAVQVVVVGFLVHAFNEPCDTASDGTADAAQKKDL